jgi:plasmid stabilization system protein ParE
MKRWTVIVPPIVQEQIRVQTFYIATDSIDNALKWEDRLNKAIDRIGDMPVHAVDEAASNRLGYVIRKTTFEGTYLIHYQVNDAARTVRILNFRHGARLPRRGEP